MNDKRFWACVLAAWVVILVVCAIIASVTSRTLAETHAKQTKTQEKTEVEYKFIPEEENPVKTAKEQPKTTLLKNVKLTAYCPCVKCCEKTDGITASGEKAVQGVTVATDKSIPFGAKMYIEGVGERVAQDRGGAIRGNRIDVYFDSHMDAVKFGVRYADVVVEG